jgi:chemotaxis protein CheZ
MSSERLISEEDYASIEAAVMETARGRWFLAEYASRNRNSDTGAVLEAIARLERVVASSSHGGEAERLRLDLIDMAGAIARTKSEIASMRPEGEGGRIGEATNELDAIVKATEQATGEILAAAEHLQEVAWTMREAGIEGAACDIIDQRATDIYTACSFQDITGQRTQKVIQVLRYLEDRLGTMIAIWGGDGMAAPATGDRMGDAALLNGPALPGRGLVQSDVDAMMNVPVDPPRWSAGLLPPLALDAEPGLREPGLREPGLLLEGEALPLAIEPPRRVEPVFNFRATIVEVEPETAPPALMQATAVQSSPEDDCPVPRHAQPRSGSRRGARVTLDDVRAEMEKADIAQAQTAGTGLLKAQSVKAWGNLEGGETPTVDSPFSPVNRPRPRTDAGGGPKAQGTAPERPAPHPRVVTLAEIEALSFDEKAALFS